MLPTILFIFLLFGLLIFFIPQISHAQRNMFAYVNPDYELFMLYPKNWEIHEGLQGHVISFISPYETNWDISREAFSVTTEDLKPCAGISLNDYVYFATEELSYSLNNFVPVGNILETSIGGSPAYLFSYQFLGNYWMHNVEIITVYGNTAYIFTYTKSSDDQQFNNSYQTMLDMVRTIKIGGSQEMDTLSQNGLLLNVKHDPAAKCGHGSSVTQFDFIPQQ